MSESALRRVAVFVEETDPGAFAWVVGELDDDDRVQELFRARRTVSTYRRAMADGLLKLQSQVDDLDEGPRTGGDAERDDDDTDAEAEADAPSPKRAARTAGSTHATKKPPPTRGTAFGFGRIS